MTFLGPGHTSYDAGDTSDVSISALKVVIDQSEDLILTLDQSQVANDGKHPLLEFAMTHFREIDVINQQPGPGGPKQDKKKKKKKASKSDWTWKDQVELVKWQGHMVDNSLMRLEHPELNKMALECFACIMR